MTVLELRQLVEVQTGLAADSSVMLHGECAMHDQLTLKASGVKNDSELYISTLTKVVVADHFRVARKDVTSSMLAELSVLLGKRFLTYCLI
jgi:hypothetical protein